MMLRRNTSESRHFEAVRETPFHPRTAAHCLANQWTRWAGYTVPDLYDDMTNEYFAVRNQVGVLDLSPMCKYRITGSDAERYMNRLLTRDIRKVKPGRVAYAVWCDDDGYVIDDGTIFRFGESDFRICCQEYQLGWLCHSAIGFDVRIEEETHEVAALAFQGPTSCAVLKRAGFSGVETLRPFDMKDYKLTRYPVTISRTGFTGDLGYELWVPAEYALDLWDALFEAGTLHDPRPFGLQALDLLRIEAGFIVTNNDFMSAELALRRNRGRTPFELGLGRLVDLGKGHFTGRRALVEAEKVGPRFRVVALEIDRNKPANDALIYAGGRKEVGYVTSAAWSPTCKRNIALATLKAPYCDRADGDLSVEIYVKKELKWYRLKPRARIVERPFFDPARRRATPPGET